MQGRLRYRFERAAWDGWRRPVPPLGLPASGVMRDSRHREKKKKGLHFCKPFICMAPETDSNNRLQIALQCGIAGLQCFVYPRMYPREALGECLSSAGSSYE